MAKYHNQEGLIPCEAPRHFPLTGDHAVYTIAKNAAIDLMEHYHAEYGIRFFALRFFDNLSVSSECLPLCRL